MTSIKRLLALSAVVLGTLVAAQSASAAPAIDGEFALPGDPRQMTLGSDGNIWVALDGSGGQDVARVAPDGTVQGFNPANLTNPFGITTGPDGNLWATENGGVVTFSPLDPNGAQKTPIAALALPQAITAGPDNTVWTASNDKVFKIPVAAPATFQEFTVAGMGARGITSGSDGLIWIADFGQQRIVSMTTAGVPTPHPLGHGGPQEVAAGLNGQIAYGNPDGANTTIGRLTLGGTPLETTTGGGDPFGVTFGLDQAYWFAQFATNDLGRLTADGQYTTLSGFAPNSGPRYLTAGANGTLWVGLQTTDRIARVTGLEAPVIDDPDDDPPADTTASIEILGKKIKLKENGGAKVKLACPADEANGPCSGRVKLKSKRLGGLAKANYEIAAGTIEKVKLKVKSDSDLERLLADDDGTKVTVIATVADALGNGAKATDKQKLKPAG